MNRLIIIAVLAIVLVVVVLTLWLQRRRAGGSESGMEGMMQAFAADALLMANNGDGTALDYSPASIEKVEQVLSKMHEEYLKMGSSGGAKAIAVIFGAYVGEVIRRSEPGSGWAQEEAVGVQRRYPLSWLGKEHFPVDWCYRRLVDGPQHSVWLTYSALKQQTAASGSQ